MKTNFFHPSLLLLFLDLEDPRWVKIRIQDKHPGSATLGYRIRIEAGFEINGRKTKRLNSVIIKFE
jgi:hypothetical protein